MSQNKTIFPGVEPGNGNPRNYQKGTQDFQSQKAPRQGTVFPGMNQEQVTNVRKTPKRNFSKPLIGFVYSISRTGFGEYWPLYIGPNTIGRLPKNDIVLSEGTVSEEHATILIRIMKNPQKLDASISDKTSSHGTMVNGESIPSTISLECKNGDIITVGESYQLYVILIDSQALGLSIAQDFIEIPSDYDSLNEANDFDERTTSPNDVPPHFSHRTSYYSQPNESFSQQRGDQTVGVNGNFNFQSGGTRPMDDISNDNKGNKGTQW